MRWFVTGTDTEVGKTLTTACLARAARSRGAVVACKPVASGAAPGTAGEDAERIAAAAGHDPLCFAAFATPVSPHRAAAAEGRELPPDLLDRVRALDADTVLVEGVGGFLVPLGGGLWVQDLCEATGGPVVVVAADRLGTLNHTLLTLAAVRAAGFDPAVVALSRHPGWQDDPSTRTNLDDLRALAGVPVVPVPTLDPADEAAQERVGHELWRAILPRSK